MSVVVHSAPRYADDAPVKDGLVALGALRERPGVELAYDVDGDALVATLATLRDVHGYQQLMEMAGVDYPDRPDRFEVVYCLLSVTKNHRIRIHVSTDEDTPVPSVTGLWPVAGWLEREIFDMYGVVFSGNSDLRRILTDYGFKGHPQRKDFPLTGYVELRYSEEEKRVVYEPVKLAQDFRSFDFMSPWEGAQYVLPGDEKAAAAPGAPTPAPAPPPAAAAPSSAPTVDKPKTTESKADTGAGEPANTKAAEPSPEKKPRTPRKPKASADDAAAPVAEVKPKRVRKPKAEGEA